MANRRIDDHSFWAGEKPEGSVFPQKSKMRSIPPSDGAGGIENYPDTEQAIHRDQGEGADQMEGRPLRPGYRY